MPDWNPQHYQQFNQERARPALDLMDHLPDASYSSILDLGCGTGEHTAILAARYNVGTVTGIDSSPRMLAKARNITPLTTSLAASLTWIEADLDTFQPEQSPDLIFSNAALHWLGDHATLFPRLASWLKPGGVLAVQMPRNFHAPSHQIMSTVAAEGPWAERLKSITLRPAPVHKPQWYQNILEPHTNGLEIWETVYNHILEGDDPVAKWARSTGLRPYLKALDDNAEREAFYRACADRLGSAYPKRKDGLTEFAFRRLFIIAKV